MGLLVSAATTRLSFIATVAAFEPEVLIFKKLSPCKWRFQWNWFQRPCSDITQRGESKATVVRLGTQRIGIILKQQSCKLGNKWTVKAIQHFWHHFLRQSEVERQPKVTMFGRFIQKNRHTLFWVSCWFLVARVNKTFLFIFGVEGVGGSFLTNSQKSKPLSGAAATAAQSVSTKNQTADSGEENKKKQTLEQRSHSPAC